MARRRIDVTVGSRAAPSTVFALLVDGSTWPRWSPIEAFELERPGDPPPEGPGAIRRFRRGRTSGRDQIVEVVPDRRFAYVSLSGLPIRDYRAHVDLEPAGEGTTIGWHASFVPNVPGTGWLVQRGLERFLADCARGLAEHAGS
jgi:hypothetical protein